MKLSKLFLATTALTRASATNLNEPRILHSVFDGERLFCTLYMSHSMPATHGVQGTETFRCATDDNLMMYIATNVPTDFFDETPFVSGSIRISVLDSCVYDNNYINMIAGDAKIIDSNVVNGMTVRKASRNLIVMRVIDSRNVGPTSSKEVFADKIFGTNGDVFNLSSGYAQCSGNQQLFVPGIYSGATNGVMDLQLSVSTEGLSANEVETLCYEAIPQLSDFNPNLYDHIMFILDPSISLLAYAYIGWIYSVFQDQWATRPSALIHELGHNLGYLHSGEGSDQYGDQSCMMGYSYSNDEGPIMCFNAAKSWYTNWYSTLHADINPLNTNDNVELKLIGINDFVNNDFSNADTTIVRITGGSEQLFMMYNKQEGINSGVPEFGDTVNIVTQSRSEAQSWTRKQLTANQEYTVSNFGGGGGQLVVKVCEIVAGTPDFARTLVYVTNVQTLSCTNTPPVTPPTPLPVTPPTPLPVTPPTPLPVTPPTPSPVTPPTPPPTSAPTASPTSVPTTSPTSVPTTSPTAAPTGDPTSAPTTSPTSLPTTSPTSTPTSLPTSTPTSAPTSAPTSSPTKSPTATPTSSPTSAPTSLPTAVPTSAPTSTPTTSPTAAPTNKPVPISCVNNPEFRLGGVKNKHCAYITYKEGRRERLCQQLRVSNDCRSSCGVKRCCADSVTYRFQNKKDKTRGCAWIGKLKRRKRKAYCDQSRRIRAECFKSCKNCQKPV